MADPLSVLIVALPGASGNPKGHPFCRMWADSDGKHHIAGKGCMTEELPSEGEK